MDLVVFRSVMVARYAKDKLFAFNDFELEHATPLPTSTHQCQNPRRQAAAVQSRGQTRQVRRRARREVRHAGVHPPRRELRRPQRLPLQTHLRKHIPAQQRLPSALHVLRAHQALAEVRRRLTRITRTHQERQRRKRRK